jgi:hypothetical protein
MLRVVLVLVLVLSVAVIEMTFRTESIKRLSPLRGLEFGLARSMG